MDVVCERSTLKGEVVIPGSKSHTIRAVAIAALAEGDSVIREPLESEDTRAAVEAYRALGATIEMYGPAWRVTGVAGRPQPPEGVIDVANSGTTMNIALGSCALLHQGSAVLTGDEQIQRRPCRPLTNSLNDLGARVVSLRGNGCPPFSVEGTLRGGQTSMEGISSQFVTSLLINTPLAEGDSHICVTVLNEQPYVEMTLAWLHAQGIRVRCDGLKDFLVPGGQRYKPVNRAIPADFSSATFFLAAGALGDNDLLLKGLDMNDTQGDRAVVDYIRQMGAQVLIEADGIHVSGKELKGCELDLNATPDALPMMAALACFAEGVTRLVNVPQARIKETDRIAVMRMELERLGARVHELPDGIVIEESALRGGEVNGHGDHRVIMALAVIATALPRPTTIHGCQAAAVTYPNFFDVLAGLGGKVVVVK